MPGAVAPCCLRSMGLPRGCADAVRGQRAERARPGAHARGVRLCRVKGFLHDAQELNDRRLKGWLGR